MFVSLPEADCCEGDVLLLLDSSGSVSNYEFSRLLHFSAGLLRVFALGRGRVRVGLLQVGTAPYLEFGLGVHHDQRGLQEALRGVQQLQGDTNTEEALREAQQLLRGARRGTPQVLLWLTDGASPGDVGRVMSGLKEDGVFVLAVSTVHGNYQVLRDAVSPPLESHLHFVDIDDIEIITQDLRAAIISMCVCVCTPKYSIKVRAFWLVLTSPKDCLRVKTWIRLRLDLG